MTLGGRPLYLDEGPGTTPHQVPDIVPCCCKELACGAGTGNRGYWPNDGAGNAPAGSVTVENHLVYDATIAGYHYFDSVDVGAGAGPSTNISVDHHSTTTNSNHSPWSACSALSFSLGIGRNPGSWDVGYGYSDNTGLPSSINVTPTTITATVSIDQPTNDDVSPTLGTTTGFNLYKKKVGVFGFVYPNNSYTWGYTGYVAQEDPGFDNTKIVYSGSIVLDPVGPMYRVSPSGASLPFQPLTFEVAVDYLGAVKVLASVGSNPLFSTPRDTISVTATTTFDQGQITALSMIFDVQIYWADAIAPGLYADQTWAGSYDLVIYKKGCPDCAE